MSQIITVDPLFERLPAKERKFKEVIVFVHHYDGHKLSFKRHMDWVNELGFDAVTFNLPTRSVADMLKQPPISREWKIGLRHGWADKIEDVLAAVDGPKIVFSFSSPSMGAIMAITRRHAIDVVAWVCDGGPFKQILRGFNNLVIRGGLLEKQPKLLNHPLVQKNFVWLLGHVFGITNYDADADRMLKSLPQGFPVLSIRGEKDVLVGSDMIDDFFGAGFGHIDYQRLIMHNSGHLMGFKQEGDLYREVTGAFLKSRATPL